MTRRKLHRSDAFETLPDGTYRHGARSPQKSSLVDKRLRAGSPEVQRAQAGTLPVNRPLRVTARRDGAK